jgi:hypothetical protein
MPDGNRRDHFRFSNANDVDGRLYMLGRAPDIGNGDLLLYQNGCDGFVENNYLYHTCDTVDGSSASLLGVMERGEIRFRGLHNGGSISNHLPAEAKTDRYKLNGGTASDRIFADRYEDRSDFAYDLQWVLRQAGCYSGKLDGDWGAASRKALAAFATATGVTLPGTEPSVELLAAVEKAAPEGMEVCRP